MHAQQYQRQSRRIVARRMSRNRRRVPTYYQLVHQAALARAKAFGPTLARRITLHVIENAERRDVPSDREFEVSILHALDAHPDA